MNRWVLGIIAAGTVAAVFWLVGTQSAAEETPLATTDIVRGEALYAENCASCHGANLEGQPNWRVRGPDGRLPAPPHDETGHTWHHDDALLFDYTKFGGRELMVQRGMEFDSGMPGFADSLTDQEIRDILGYIRSTWPEDIREMQAERTRAANAGRGE